MKSGALGNQRQMCGPCELRRRCAGPEKSGEIEALVTCGGKCAASVKPEGDMRML